MAVSYRVNINGLGTGGSHTFDSDPGGDAWTDQWAITLGTALNNLTWPPNCQFLGIDRLETSQSTTSLDLTTDPPTFH